MKPEEIVEEIKNLNYGGSAVRVSSRGEMESLPSI